MKVDITNIVPAEETDVNQVYHMSWKIDGEPDSAYRPLPDATTDPDGNIINPVPYSFLTGTVSPDIWVRAINACDSSYVFAVLVPGLGMCCPSGYTLSPDGLSCSLTETVAPTVTQAGVCVACSQLSNNYGIFGAKLWSAFNYNSDLTDSNYTLLTGNYWQGNPVGGATSIACDGAPGPFVGTPPSPVNRQGVWLDSNCDGSKNPLSTGAALQFTWLINSPSPSVVYVGMAGDNNFTLTINGTQIVSKPTGGGTDNFRYFYLFPVNLISGSNFIGGSFIGDGTVADMGAMIIVSNTAAELAAVTNDSQIDYLFQTSQMIGSTPIDIATCPAGYTLDTSGGAGNYVCVRITTVPATEC